MRETRFLYRCVTRVERVRDSVVFSMRPPTIEEYNAETLIARILFVDPREFDAMMRDEKVHHVLNADAATSMAPWQIVKFREEVE